MSVRSTLPGGQSPRAVGGSLTHQAAPGLLFHKWQCHVPADHQRGSREKDPQLEFLEQVAKAVEAVTIGGSCQAYRAWHERYLKALGALEVKTEEAATVWRLVSGMATNPAFETGLDLHPLFGFPYLPGSAVRGLIHHAAEASLLEEREAWLEEPMAALAAAPEVLEEFVREAETVREVFGGLTVEQKEAKAEVPTVPRRLIEIWLAEHDWPPAAKPYRARLRNLVREPTSGRLVVYDAIPALEQSSLVEPDLLNTHYPRYYREPKVEPPSDDQNPVPVYFLAVRPGVRFVFPFRLRTWAAEEGGEKGLESQARKVELEKAIRRWLWQGLTEIGAGGKTAAGYGYFTELKVSQEEARKERP